MEDVEKIKKFLRCLRVAQDILMSYAEYPEYQPYPPDLFPDFPAGEPVNLKGVLRDATKALEETSLRLWEGQQFCDVVKGLLRDIERYEEGDADGPELVRAVGTLVLQKIKNHMPENAGIELACYWERLEERE
jgi:hypothetical protein